MNPLTNRNRGSYRTSFGVRWQGGRRDTALDEKRGVMGGYAPGGVMDFLLKRRRRFALPAHSKRSGFTMIEIAISLAVIGFALVAVIGILPTGMNVQKANRQETIINQDLTIFLNAIRNGERHVDDLTNYVMGITNYVTQFSPRGAPVASHIYGYVPTGSSVDGAAASPQYPITNGFRIVGLLSTPKIVPTIRGGGYLSNHVIAIVRSVSGPASEKYPQNNPTAQELALSYRLISDVIPYGTNFYNPAWTNWNDPLIAQNTNEILRRYFYSQVVSNYQANLHELRLTFRWPLLPNGNTGPERQAFRTTVSGFLDVTNEPGFPASQQYALYFFRPRTYVKAP